MLSNNNAYNAATIVNAHTMGNWLSDQPTMRVLVNDLVKVVKNTQSLSFNITNELLGFDARKAEFIDEQPKEFLIYKTLFNLYHDLCATECMLQDIYEHVKGFGITEKE